MSCSVQKEEAQRRERIQEKRTKQKTKITKNKTRQHTVHQDVNKGGLSIVVVIFH